jgi:hypothetical protein
MRILLISELTYASYIIARSLLQEGADVRFECRNVSTPLDSTTGAPAEAAYEYNSVSYEQDTTSLEYISQRLRAEGAEIFFDNPGIYSVIPQLLN